MEEINGQISEFSITVNDTLFIENNYGSMDVAYLKADLVSTLIADTVFQLPIGAVYGPYIENDAYRAVKIRDRMVIADSAHARHILLRAQTLEQYQAAQKTADSLVTLLKTGAESFDSLATRFTQDPTGMSNGGDLGNFELGRMVKEFNDLAFYTAELNRPYTVITQFGVHVVEVLERTFETKEEGVQLAFLNIPIIPSETTQDSLYDRILDFAGTNRTMDEFKAAVASLPGKTIQVSSPFKKNDFTLSALGSGQVSREIIRWAYDPATEVDVVSPEVYIYQKPPCTTIIGTSLLLSAVSLPRDL
ncbi:MAG: peptidylprolyl isomerase [Saprospiraceae bacterium]|nr:peptidylprolyl isomerase [Saprospiraceae bacterium]